MAAVLMLCAEDDDNQLHRRFDHLLRRLAIGHPLEKIELLKRNLHIKSLVGMSTLMTSTDPNTREVGSTKLVAQLIAEAKQIPDLVLIIIDPASRFRGGDENAAEDTTRFVQALERIAKELGVTVLVAHHSNKGAFSASEQNQSASRGSSALTDGVRWQMNLMTFSDREAKKYGIPSDQRGFYLTASVTKSNYAPPQPSVILHRLEGGYLQHVDLAPAKEAQVDDLKKKLLNLLRFKLADQDRPTYSKTSFVNEVGGKDGPLGVGNNAVRDVMDALIAEGLVLIVKGKISLPERDGTRSKKS